MKLLLILLLGAAGAAWFYPPYAEQTETVCAAFEKKLGTLVQGETKRLPPALGADPRVTALMGLMNSAIGAADGLLAEYYIKDNYPQLPPSAGCVVAYWKVTFDPDLTQYLKGRLPAIR